MTSSPSPIDSTTDPKTRTEQRIKATQIEALLEPGFDQLAQDDDDDRTVRITFRVSPSEAERLKQYCNGIERSQFIRAAIFHYPMPRPRTIVPQIDRDTYIELGRIGTNINQQTRAMNEAMKLGIPPTLGRKYMALLEELKDAIDRIRLNLANPTDSEQK